MDCEPLADYRDEGQRNQSSATRDMLIQAPDNPVSQTLPTPERITNG